MTSTFMGLEIGKRGVAAHEQALRVTGHNLSNASTDGYSRQRVELSTFVPIYMPGLEREDTPGQLGQGTVVSRIERIRDELLDNRIVAQSGQDGYWTTRDPYLRQLDAMYLEIGDNSLRARMLSFWDGWQELAQQPASLPPRTALIERGQSLIDSFHDRFSQLRDMQNQADAEIRFTINRINEITGELAGLNRSIQKIKAQGDEPNDLYDRRGLLVDELARVISISVDRSDKDEFILHTGGLVLVQGGVPRKLEAESDPNEDGYANIRWADTREPFDSRPGNTRYSGNLAALLELRDGTIRNELQILDNLAMNFVDLVNEAHRPGYGINGRTGLDFFTEHHFVTNVQGNYDRDGDGEYDSSYIFRINGTNKLEARAQIGLEGTIRLSRAALPGETGSQADNLTVEIPYYAEDTVEDLISRINNSGADVVARLNREGRLSLKGTVTRNARDSQGLPVPDFVIRHIEDSGRFLEAYSGILAERGPEGAYDWQRPDAVNALNGVAAAANIPAGNAAGDTIRAEFSTAPVTHPAGWIEINRILVRDYASIASGYGKNGRPAEAGNNKAAEAIAAIQNTRVMVGTLATMDDYFADSVARVGLIHQVSEEQVETQDQILKNLKDLRDSISGVNMDEELSNMIKFQHGYAAAARFISTMNSMLDIVVRLGQAA